MIETMEGKITPLCAEIRGVKGDQVQVGGVQLQVVAGVRVQFCGRQELSTVKHVVGMHETVQVRLWFPVQFGLSMGTVWERRR
jgi:hypothetical protein